MEIAFFLMTKKGLAVLNSFVREFGKDSVAYVISSKDKNVINDYYDEIKLLCSSSKIPFYDRKEKYTLDLDIFHFAISWRWLIFGLGKKLIITHDSLLPKYRGFAPLVNCLKNGEREIGVSALYADEEYDKGNIIAQERIQINYPIKIIDAISKIEACFSKLVLKVSQLILHGSELPSIPQDEEKATYSLWLNDDDYHINWNDDCSQIQRHIDAVGFPYKGACTYIDDKLIRISDSEIIEDKIIENRCPGKIIFLKDKKPVVVCRKGLLLVKDAYYDNDQSTIFPLKSFRIKFT